MPKRGYGWFSQGQPTCDIWKYEVLFDATCSTRSSHLPLTRPYTNQANFSYSFGSQDTFFHWREEVWSYKQLLTSVRPSVNNRENDNCHAFVHKL